MRKYKDLWEEKWKRIKDRINTKNKNKNKTRKLKREVSKWNAGYILNICLKICYLVHYVYVILWCNSFNGCHSGIHIDKTILFSAILAIHAKPITDHFMTNGWHQKITLLIITITKFLNVIVYHQPDLSTCNWTVY